MAEELKMWAIEGGGGVAPVERASHTETENLLEETLVKNPDMLIPGLELVGWQTPTDGGWLDLLGVDPDGRLVVFELKRGDLTRDAVTQIIDYASDLEAMSDDQLVARIAQHSGRDGIAEIEDFEGWYDQRFEERRLSPIRMILVGLGTDARATRMVNFLAARGVDVSLLTFHGYEHEGKTLLARQVRVEPEATGAAGESRSWQEIDKERRRAIDELAKNHDVGDIFGEAVERFQRLVPWPATLKDGYTFRADWPLRLPEHDTKFGAPLSLRITRNGEMRVTFFPISAHLCEAQFRKVEQSIPFKRESPRNAPPTNDVSEQWYCILDRSEWNTHKETLFGLVSAVSAAWDEAGRNAGPQTEQSADMVDTN